MLYFQYGVGDMPKILFKNSEFGQMCLRRLL